MTEIKLTLDNPAGALEQLRHAAETLDFCEPLFALADSIEEQVRPSLEEPTGDVVVFITGVPFWPREGGVHWVTQGHSNNPPTWGELTDGVGRDAIQIYRNETELTELASQPRRIGANDPTRGVDLEDPQVVRIDRGEPSAFDTANMAAESARLDGADADNAAFTEGFDAACNEILKELQAIRRDAITAERQDGLDRAIGTVERQRDAR